MNKLLTILLLCNLIIMNAQELNCNLTVNYQNIGATNQKVFKTLETSISEFINKTAWTTKAYKQHEKIACSMTIIIEKYDNANAFEASLQVQSSRVAFNSTYQSPILNYNDKNFNFKYQEFEQLLFNPNSFESNLLSVIAFYSYLIIGLDQDSFSTNGGTENFENALNICNLAQSSGYKGWSPSEKGQNRFLLINDLVSPTFSTVREVLHDYHLKGIDLMSADTKQAKTKIATAINNLKTIHLMRPNSFLMRVFFDAKSDEIVSIFSAGPKIPVTELLENLNKVSPLNSAKWSGIN